MKFKEETIPETKETHFGSISEKRLRLHGRIKDNKLNHCKIDNIKTHGEDSFYLYEWEEIEWLYKELGELLKRRN